MSTNFESNNTQDLIDFHVGPSSSSSSSVLPASSANNDTIILCESDHLIDTELPIFEQKLLSQSNSIPHHHHQSSRRNSSSIVNVEDILINIDDDDDDDDDEEEEEEEEIKLEYECDSLDGEQVDTNEFLSICESEDVSAENYEALIVLKKLDAILNATLNEMRINTETETEEISDEDADEETRYVIEECLGDLDNYLKSYGSDDDDDESEEYANECGGADSSSSTTTTTTTEEEISRIQKEHDEDFNEDVARLKLRQFEENYRKFISSSGIVNRAFILDTEHNGNLLFTPNEHHHKRPSSACAIPTQVDIIRKLPFKSNTHGRSRSRLIRRKSLLNEHHIPPSERISATADAALSISTLNVDDDDCNNEHSSSTFNINRERHAHASNNCSTGTVIVEPMYYSRQRNTVDGINISSHEESTEEEHRQQQQQEEVVLVDEENEENSNLNGRSWQRSSMRRLQQVELPPHVNSSINSEDATATTTRPLSAPSRLSTLMTSTAASSSSINERSSRSRSRHISSSTVEHHHQNHHHHHHNTSSASESSEFRRERSISSTRTISDDAASSADSSSLNRMPQSNNFGNNNSAAESASNNNNNNNNNQSAIIRCDHNSNNNNEMPEAESPLGKWPHSFSSMMACLGCTLGLFNISRFAVLTVHFGGNFIIQFIFLTIVFGLPLFTLQLCLGQKLGAGVIDMWRISPLFQGVGVCLLITQAFIGLYSIIGVSWMFVYFRDSFITALDKYRWAEPFYYYRKEIQSTINGTYNITETIPDYFSGIVLQRYNVPNAYGRIKFQSAFNLAVVWMIVFVSLSKGLRSYGKVIYVFTLLPIFSMFVLCAKILGMIPPEFIGNIFPETDWGEFFLNSRSWLAAGQETFLTWGLLGAAIMQISSHNKHKHLLQRDSSLIALLTIAVLLLVAFLANTCVQILRSYGYQYYPSSFERISSYQFLRRTKDHFPSSSSISNTPIRYMQHNSFILGEKVLRPESDRSSTSGYQVLRFATEILPATFAVIGADQLSPFWAVLTYFTLIMFGIAQQLAIWHCVITGIMAIKADVLKKWESTITFFSCACGLIVGLPMATDLGIYMVYFLDYTIGSIWWLSIVFIVLILAVFLVRGRPYSGDTVVKALFNPYNSACLTSCAPPLLSFTWNVILPVFLMILCITTFKNNSFRDMFVWHHAPSSDYWPLYVREIGSILQLLLIFCIPLVALIQSYRYLNNGPSDILERFQLLYRPSIGEHMETPAAISAGTVSNNSNNNTRTTNPSVQEDPPPKYTPPPSYTTATGVRLAKFLRQSIRSSMRRLANVLGEGSSSSSTAAAATASSIRTRPSVQTSSSVSSPPPPPDYNAVFVEMNGVHQERHQLTTLERLRKLQASPNALTAADVASILRSSFRRSRLRRSPLESPSSPLNFAEHGVESLSAEHLVDAAAPIGETSLVTMPYSATVNNNDDNNAEEAASSGNKTTEVSS